MRLISKKQVIYLVPYSYTHLKREIDAGRFPKPVKHVRRGNNPRNYKAFWVEDEVLNWIDRLIRERDNPIDAPNAVQEHR